MTPAEHIAEAERLLATAYEDGVPLPLMPSSNEVKMAIAHALIALAVENGVPHTSAPAGGAQGGS